MQYESSRAECIYGIVRYLSLTVGLDHLNLRLICDRRIFDRGLLSLPAQIYSRALLQDHASKTLLCTPPFVTYVSGSDFSVIVGWLRSHATLLP